MKKGLQLSAAAVIALSAITPVATAAAAEPTAQQVKPGIYTTEGYKSIADFKKLTTAKKAALLQMPGAVLVVGTDVIPTEVILTGSNEDLENSKVSVEKYQEDNNIEITEGGIKPITPGETGTVSAVSAINPITLANGADITEKLPTTVEATLKTAEGEEAKTTTLNIAWTTPEGFDATVAGEYTFTGTLSSSNANVVIPEELASVTVKVTVQEAKAAVEVDSVSAINPITLANGADITEKLPTTVEAT
ncbi:Ig-like domain-containing protein, partial [Lysinibacillus boronitolerans]|uniref:Ig-like domain-containing protein n=1 Tax=Lysinibacillus boronitolerans TaxID=309788 RepID=UPI0038543B8E